jgi:hypothetical protein
MDKQNKSECVLDKPPNWWPLKDDESSHRFLDHVKYLRSPQYFKDKDVVISEVYNMDKDVIFDLIDFCDEYNLRFLISGNSSWNPKDCFRVTFCNDDNVIFP